MTRTRSGGLAAAVALALVLPAAPFLLVGELPGADWLDARSGDPLAFGATGAALLAIDVLAPVPSSVVMTLLGARLGLAGGWLWAFAGLMAGNLAGYAIGRALLARCIGDARQRSLRAPGLWLIIVSRPVPVLAEAATLAAGATATGAARFALAAGLANALYALALVASGVALLPQSLLGPGLLVAVLVPALAWLAWRRLDRHGRAARTGERPRRPTAPA